MEGQKKKIIWADDEIDNLRSHILFLEDKGYAVTPVTNAEDAITLIGKQRFDVLLLDEMMSGLDGLEALTRIKEIHPSLPVIMITKSEEENLMEEALGDKIEDYLTKPVNPSQILSSCKRILEKERIERDKLTREYTIEFREISASLDGDVGPNDWIDIHTKLSEREIDLDHHADLGLTQTVQDQRKECNQAFGRYIQEVYRSWLETKERPVLSMDLMGRYVIPALKAGEKVLFIVIDNLRLDQWLIIEPLLYDFFSIQRDTYFSIVPTATPFSRNSIFAGKMPSEIQANYPGIWRSGVDDETSRNQLEPQLMSDQLERAGIQLHPEPKYIKVLNADEAKQAAANVDTIFLSPFVAMVFNFVDILAHRRSESQILKEIVPDASAYRALTRNWFEHSILFLILKSAAKSKRKVIITSDHGSVRALRGSTVYADRETSTNLRYKYGRGIRGEKKHIFEIREPTKYGLPSFGINTNYLIAKEDYYFVYPTNYHRYLSLYRDSLQHGGISLEEMILPVAVLDVV